MVEIPSGEAGAKAMASRSGHRYLHSNKAIPGMAHLEKTDLGRTVMRKGSPFILKQYLSTSHGGLLIRAGFEPALRELLRDPVWHTLRNLLAHRSVHHAPAKTGIRLLL